VVEPGRALTAASYDEIERARSVLPLEAVEGKTPKSEVNAAREAIDAAAQAFVLPEGSRGFLIDTDWRAGKVRLTGDARAAESLVSESSVDARLVLIEDARATTRLTR
jgi:hypothetical protein